MQKNSNRKGLALGAVFALVSSLFVGSAPAQANEAAVVTYPATGTSTQTSMLMTETFELAFRYGTGVAAALRTYGDVDTSAGFGVIVTKPAGVTVSYAVTNSNSVANVGTANFANTSATSYELGLASSGSPVLAIGLPDRTSVSAAVAVSVQAFLDVDKDGEYSAGDVLGNTVTINFVPFSAMGTTATLGQPVSGDTGATASFTVTQGTINWTQLNDTFTVEVLSTNDHSSATASFAVSAVELVSATSVSSTTSPEKTTSAANYSVSATLLTAVYTASPTVESLSAVVKYGPTQVAQVLPLAVQAVGASGATLSAVTGVNVKQSGAGTADARFNSAFVLNAYAHTTSVTTSVAVARTVTVSSITNMELDADSGVIVNGVTYTSSATLLAAGFTLAAGTNTFAVSTFGQTDTSGTDSIAFAMSYQLLGSALTVNFVTTALTPEVAVATVSGLAGASKTFAVSVEDQWGVAPIRTDLRISGTVALGASTSIPVTATVVAGEASVTLTPTPATRTGSATVTLTLEQFDQGTQAWVAGNSDTATWNVYSYTAGTDAFTSRTASISASVSYGVDLTWSPTAIALVVANSFSDISVAAPGLMIQYVNDTTMTASDALTVAADGKNASFKFTGRMAGTYTVTFTNGGVTTTSQVIVDPAASNAGKTITFDTTTIPAGSTRVITGTLVDTNGNPVNTSGSATILVTYVPGGSAGIPIGVMPTETDADGEFSFTVLTGGNDAGTAVVTATYYKSGAATAIAEVLAFNQSITVGGAAATAPASNQKLTVGSFKGFVAIYALNYTGQKLSAKVAGKWLVVEALASRYERVVRNTGAAIPIIVDLYIDGAFVRTENIVTK